MLCCGYDAGDDVVDFGVKAVAGLGDNVLCCECGCGDSVEGLAGDITGLGDICGRGDI